MAAKRAGIAAELSLRPLASAIDIQRAVRLIEDVAIALGKARRWALPREAVKEIANQAFHYHQSPACRHCSGTGKRVVNICTHCKGSGKHPIPSKYRDQIDAVLVVLRGADERVAEHIKAVMR